MHPDVRKVDLPPEAPGLDAIGLEFNPETCVMTVTWNDKIVLEHSLRFLVTARSQIYFGQDPTFGKQERFSGRIWFAQPELLEASTGK